VVGILLQTAREDSPQGCSALEQSLAMVPTQVGNTSGERWSKAGAAAQHAPLLFLPVRLQLA
jgi:hypothetical protein